MATKSIYKEIRIKDKLFCKTFVSALENAQNKKGKEVTLKRRVDEVRDIEELTKMFKD